MAYATYSVHFYESRKSDINKRSYIFVKNIHLYYYAKGLQFNFVGVVGLPRYNYFLKSKSFDSNF